MSKEKNPIEVACTHEYTKTIKIPTSLQHLQGSKNIGAEDTGFQITDILHMSSLGKDYKI